MQIKYIDGQLSYFFKVFLGVEDAVRDYCEKHQINYLPIEDTLSIVIRKK